MKVITSITIEKELLDRLKEASAKSKRTVSGSISYAVELFLQTGTTFKDQGASNGAR